ncbi:efflux RND transporter periplasmic adaptor subunit [Pseudoduganella sp. RAF53_2]|uniref:efflux RND transporter periplasmic adaptor subunit n=1 Tax=unclassified Pseudoduganella TaxID=2637179 RepID=UPI003F98A086
MKRVSLIGGALALAAAVGAGYWAGSRHDSGREPAPAAPADKKVLYWHDPMVPGQHFDKPGKSPFMEMQLVPVYAEDSAASGVAIDSRTRQNLGLRTSEVKKGQLAGMLEAPGAVAWDESQAVVVQARSAGIVERLKVRTPLAQVRKGQVLAELYVPEFVAAQEEYLAARKLQAEGMQGVAEAALQRMRLAGMSEGQIQSVVRSGTVQPRVAVIAPASGVVAELGVREGASVGPGATLFRLNGTASVWVVADVPQSAGGQIAPGSAATVYSNALPGETLTGKVNAVLPDIDAATRTRKVRVDVINPGGRLAPGTFASVRFASPTAAEVLLIPSEAVIRTGKRNVVFVVSGEGRFEAVEVDLGSETGGETEVRKGLRAGQRVVVSGQFLVDSEASLRGAESRLGAGREADK